MNNNTNKPQDKSSNINDNSDVRPVFSTINEDLPPIIQDGPPSLDVKNPSPGYVTSPSDDTFITPVQNSNVTTKNHSGFSKKIIATIFAVILLVGGVGAGIVLVRQQQNVSEKAAGLECGSWCEAAGGSAGECDCGAGYDCQRGFCVAVSDGGGGTGGGEEDGPTACTPGQRTTCQMSNSCLGYQDCNALGSWGGCVQADPACGTTNQVCSPGDQQQGGSCTTSEGCSGVIIQVCNAPGTRWYDSYCDPDTNCSDTSNELISGRCQGNSDCANGYNCNSSGFCIANTETSSCGRDQDPTAPVCCTNLTECPGVIVCEPTARKECKSKDAAGNEFWCLMEANSDWCSGSGGSTTGSGASAMCQDIKIYDANWNQLLASQMSQLKTGDILNITVRGQATTGTFTKARFTINGTLRPEVTAKKPGTEEFVDVYTIPVGITYFSVSADVYHETLGWR